MNKQRAEQVREKVVDLMDKVLTHKKYGYKMKVLEIGVKEVAHQSDRYYVYCRLKSENGEIDEPLDEILKNYLVL